MFDVSFTEMGVILLVALLVLGPEKLPDTARFLGKFFASAKRQSEQVRREFYNALYPPTSEITKAFNDAKRTLTSYKESVAPDCPDYARIEKEFADKNPSQANTATNQTANQTGENRAVASELESKPEIEK